MRKFRAPDPAPAPTPGPCPTVKSVLVPMSKHHLVSTQELPGPGHRKKSVVRKHVLHRALHQS